MNNVVDWWTEFFFQAFGELQLAGMQAEHTEAEVTAIEALLSAGEKLRVLDAPCGPGRHSLELARRGHQVTGLDFNPKVLDQARERARAESLELTLRQGDLRELRDQGEYDLVLNHWGSFGYFDDAENAALLVAFGRALRPGGSLFLDAHVAESLFPKFAKRAWSPFGSSLRILEDRRYLLETGRVDVTWTFIENGQERSFPTSIRIYTYRELRELLQAAGFSSFVALDPTGAPFELGSSRLRLLARKAA